MTTSFILPPASGRRMESAFTPLIPTPVKPFGSMTPLARSIWDNLTAEPMPKAASPPKVTLLQVRNKSSWLPDAACLLLSIGRLANFNTSTSRPTRDWAVQTSC